MIKKCQQQIKQYLLTQNKPGELLLFLYFSEALTMSLHDKWLEKTADLPQLVQQQLNAVDAILTACCKKGLCDCHSMIVLRGIHFYDPELHTYANRYVYQNKQEEIENKKLMHKQLPRFANIEYQQECAIISIHGVGDRKYRQTLSAFLQENSIYELETQNMNSHSLNNTPS
jgi:hypothetical protein